MIANVAMRLRNWRIEKNLTLREAAELFGIGGGANPSRRMQRIETGEAPVDAILADAIVRETDEAVTLLDLNETRKEFLNSANSSPESAS